MPPEENAQEVFLGAKRPAEVAGDQRLVLNLLLPRDPVTLQHDVSLLELYLSFQPTD